MWSSTLPTATVREERSPRTYPVDVPAGETAADEGSSYPTRSELERAARERDRLSKRCRRLESQLRSLEDELDRERRERQQLLEQYEFKLADERRKRGRTPGRFERAGATIGRTVDRLVGSFR